MLSVTPAHTITFGHRGVSNAKAYEKRQKLVEFFESHQQLNSQTGRTAAIEAIALEVDLKPETVKTYWRKWLVDKLGMPRPHSRVNDPKFQTEVLALKNQRYTQQQIAQKSNASTKTVRLALRQASLNNQAGQ
jgi:transposase-like protein